MSFITFCPELCPVALLPCLAVVHGRKGFCILELDFLILFPFPFFPFISFPHTSAQSIHLLLLCLVFYIDMSLPFTTSPIGKPNQLNGLGVKSDDGDACLLACLP